MFDCRNTLNNLSTFAILRGRSIFSRTLGHRGKTFTVQKESGQQNQRLDVWLLGVRWVNDWSSWDTTANTDRCNRWEDSYTDKAWNTLFSVVKKCQSLQSPRSSLPPGCRGKMIPTTRRSISSSVKRTPIRTRRRIPGYPGLPGFARWASLKRLVFHHWRTNLIGQLLLNPQR